MGRARLRDHNAAAITTRLAGRAAGVSLRGPFFVAGFGGLAEKGIVWSRNF